MEGLAHALSLLLRFSCKFLTFSPFIVKNEHVMLVQDYQEGSLFRWDPFYFNARRLYMACALHNEFFNVLYMYSWLAGMQFINNLLSTSTIFEQDTLSKLSSKLNWKEFNSNNFFTIFLKFILIENVEFEIQTDACKAFFTNAMLKCGISFKLIKISLKKKWHERGKTEDNRIWFLKSTN